MSVGGVGNDCLGGFEGSLGNECVWRCGKLVCRSVGNDCGCDVELCWVCVCGGVWRMSVLGDCGGMWGMTVCEGMW